jgi:hypothetical protein
MSQQLAAAIPLTALERDQLELRAIGQVGEATFYSVTWLLASYADDETLYYIADQRIRTYIDDISGIDREIERAHERIAQLEANKAQLEQYARAPFARERGI